MKTKLYRSQTDSMIGGVCSGLGKYLDIDPVLVRLVFMVMALANGVGILIYFVLWIITPLEGQDDALTVEETARANVDEIARRARTMGDDMRRAASGPNPQAGIIIGAILVVLGAILLLQRLNSAWLRWLDFDALWALILIAIGVAILLRREAPASSEGPPEPIAPEELGVKLETPPGPAAPETLASEEPPELAAPEEPEAPEIPAPEEPGIEPETSPRPESLALEEAPEPAAPKEPEAPEIPVPEEPGVKLETPPGPATPETLASEEPPEPAAPKEPEAPEIPLPE